MEIWIHKNGQLAGRFSESAIREKIADGSFSAADLAWSETKSAWQPIPEFLESLPKTSLESAAPSTEKAVPEPVEKAVPPEAESSTPSTEKAALEPIEKTPSMPEPESPRPATTAKPPPLPTTPSPIP
ncbi:MAG TPA: GYF domain-containing protein, partial [Chthoniobacterales bacterium]